MTRTSILQKNVLVCVTQHPGPVAPPCGDGAPKRMKIKPSSIGVRNKNAAAVLRPHVLRSPHRRNEKLTCYLTGISLRFPILKTKGSKPEQQIEAWREL